MLESRFKLVVPVKSILPGPFTPLTPVPRFKKVPATVRVVPKLSSILPEFAFISKLIILASKVNVNVVPVTITTLSLTPGIDYAVTQPLAKDHVFVSFHIPEALK